MHLLIYFPMSKFLAARRSVLGQKLISVTSRPMRFDLATTFWPKTDIFDGAGILKNTNHNENNNTKMF